MSYVDEAWLRCSPNGGLGRVDGKRNLRLMGCLHSTMGEQHLEPSWLWTAIQGIVLTYISPGSLLLSWGWHATEIEVNADGRPNDTNYNTGKQTAVEYRKLRVNWKGKHSHELGSQFSTNYQFPPSSELVRCKNMWWHASDLEDNNASSIEVTPDYQAANRLILASNAPPHPPHVGRGQGY